MLSKLNMTIETKIIGGIIMFLIVITIWMVIIVHDQYVDYLKAHDQWYNAWKGGILSSNDCSLLQSMANDDEGKWIKSELYPLVKQRLGELRC